MGIEWVQIILASAMTVGLLLIQTLIRACSMTQRF